jgi:hypothetical protein
MALGRLGRLVRVMWLLPREFGMACWMISFVLTILCFCRFVFMTFWDEELEKSIIHRYMKISFVFGIWVVMDDILLSL